MMIFRRETDYLVFDRPVERFRAQESAGVRPLIEALEARAGAQGLWLTFGLTYESASSWDEALQTRAPGGQGLFAKPMAAYAELHGVPEVLDARALSDRLAPSERNGLPWLAFPEPSWTAEDYERAFERVRYHLHRGDTYQVNLTFGLSTALLQPGRGSPPYGPADFRALFLRLTGSGQGRFAAYAEADDRVWISLSPELFFRTKPEDAPSRAALIESRPMKGTAPRSLDPEEDRLMAESLLLDPKSRAENLMITDMIRNDLGRVAIPGSVRVDPLFALESYPTVHQMVSGVGARTHAGLSELFSALFPCASITGAPKAETMRLISEIESQPRGIYTGTLGWLEPSGRIHCNVAIRTLEMDARSGRGRLGVGGGVVWDSRAGDEYAEALLKGRFLNLAVRDFSLTEALLWEPETGYFLPDRHFDRLGRAAKDWGGQLSRAEWDRCLRDASGEASSEALKVRVLLSPDGRLSWESAPAGNWPLPALTALALESAETSDVYHRYKTDRRAQAYERFKVPFPKAREVILYNGRGELTEGTSTNLVLEIGGRKLTPAVSCGLLEGTFRAELLSRGEIEEAILDRADFYRADRVWLINSVRRWIEAERLK